MEQFIKAKVLTKTFSAWGSCYYASVPAVDYIEPFKTVVDADVRIEADGQAWTMGIDNGTLKQSPSVYAMRPNSPSGQLWVVVIFHRFLINAAVEHCRLSFSVSGHDRSFL